MTNIQYLKMHAGNNRLIWLFEPQAFSNGIRLSMSICLSYNDINFKNQLIFLIGWKFYSNITLEPFKSFEFVDV